MFHMPSAAFEGLENGVLRVDKEGTIKYVNDYFKEIVGGEEWIGENVAKLFPDDGTFLEIQARLKRRLEKQIAERYTIYVTRQDKLSKSHVEILAFPEIDEDGSSVGALAVIKDVSAEFVAKRMHEYIEKCETWTTILDRVAETVRPVLPYDWFNVSLFSADGKHVRHLYSTDETGVPKWAVRWNELLDVVLEMIEEQKILRFSNLEEHLSDSKFDELRKNESFQQFEQLGFKSCLWYPIIQAGRVVAAVALYHHQEGVYRKIHEEIMKELPFRNVIDMTLYHINTLDLQFRLDLVRRMSNIQDYDGDGESKQGDSDLKNVASILVKEIKKHYEWSNVSLFRVDAMAGKFVLLRESYDDASFSYGEGYEQDLDTGVLGAACRQRKSVRVGDISAAEGLQTADAAEKTKSALAIPVIVKDEVCAVLLSEDAQKNAYAQEEQEALEHVLSEVSAIYRRVELEQVVKAILESAADAVFRTDNSGIISWANDSAAELLGAPTGDLKGKSLGEFIEDRELAKYFLKPSRLPSSQVQLVRKDGATRHVLASGAPLPEEIGGRVYVAGDLSTRKRQERLEYITTLYHEIANQTLTPISLCHSWIRRLKSACETSDESETLEKIVQQLRKVQVTFDRLSRFERDPDSYADNPMLLDLSYVIEGITSECPNWERRFIENNLPGDLPDVRVDFSQIDFCFRSVLFYLIKARPPDGLIRIDASRDPGNVRVDFSGAACGKTRDTLGEYADQEWSARILNELMVGKESIRKIAEKNNVGIELPRRFEDNVSFTFTFAI